MQELKHSTLDFNLYQHLIKSKKNDFLQHVRYKYIKKNYIQSLAEHSDYIFEIVEGAVKVGLYSENKKEILYEILTPGDFYGSYFYKNKPLFDLVKALTHVKVRIYEVNFIKHLTLSDTNVAKFFYQISLSTRNIGEPRFNS